MVRRVRSKKRVQPSSAGSEFGESTGPILVRQARGSEKGPFLSPNSEPWKVPSSEKGPDRTLVQQVRSSEKGPFLYLNSEPGQVRSSEKGLGRTLVQQVLSSEKGPFRVNLGSASSE